MVQRGHHDRHAERRQQRRQVAPGQLVLAVGIAVVVVQLVPLPLLRLFLMLLLFPVFLAALLQHLVNGVQDGVALAAVLQVGVQRPRALQRTESMRLKVKALECKAIARSHQKIRQNKHFKSAMLEKRSWLLETSIFVIFLVMRVKYLLIYREVQVTIFDP